MPSGKAPRMLPSTFKEKQIRLYYTAEDLNHINKAIQCFEKWCEENKVNKKDMVSTNIWATGSESS